jgi:YD repeat-containing protein
MFQRAWGNGGALLNPQTGDLTGDEVNIIHFQDLPAGEKLLELWLPQAATISISDLALSKDATWSASYVDDWDVPASVTDPLSGVTQYNYDNRLNTILVRDPWENRTYAYYDDLNLPAQVTDALGNLIQYQYSAEGNLTKLTDARGKIYDLLWQDGASRKQFKWPDTTSENSSYDINGRLTNLSARGGEAAASFTRNVLGELTQREWSYNGQGGTNSYSRNAGGQLSSATASEGGFTIAQGYGYDTNGRLNNLTQTASGVSRSIGLGYDAAGGLTNLSYPSGMSVGYEYNGDGQVTSISMGATTLASYSYDTGGRLTTRTLGNGVTTSYAYDGANQVTNITVSKGAANLWAESYAYDMPPGRGSARPEAMEATATSMMTPTSSPERAMERVPMRAAPPGAMMPLVTGAWNRVSAGPTRSVLATQST